MSWKIFNKADMVVIVDTTDFDTEKHAPDQIWYTYISTEAPILYSVNQRSPERPLILDQDYTQFLDEDGNGFNSDLQLQEYLDSILGRAEVSTGVVSVNDQALLNKMNDLLISVDTMTEKLNVINMHLALLTENWITEKDL